MLSRGCGRRSTELTLRSPDRATVGFQSEIGNRKSAIDTGPWPSGKAPPLHEDAKLALSCLLCYRGNMDEFIVSDEYDGQRRRLYPHTCEICGTKTYVPKNRLEGRRYCSPQCAQLGQRIRVRLVCAYCGKEFERAASKDGRRTASGLNFCSRSCKDHAQRIGGIEAIQPDHYGNGIRNYRVKALRVDEEACCAECGYHEYIAMLDVHHKDGNRSNSALDNLEILCVWCHALRTRGVPRHRF